MVSRVREEAEGVRPPVLALALVEEELGFAADEA